MDCRCRDCRLQAIEDKLDVALFKLTNAEALLVGLKADFDAKFALLDTETTAIGANIAAIAAKVTNGMSDADVAAVKADFDTLSARLTTLAVDPTVPVPPPPPPLQALRKGHH